MLAPFRKVVGAYRYCGHCQSRVAHGDRLCEQLSCGHTRLGRGSEAGAKKRRCHKCADLGRAQ